MTGYNTSVAPGFIVPVRNPARPAGPPLPNAKKEVDLMRAQRAEQKNPHPELYPDKRLKLLENSVRMAISTWSHEEEQAQRLKHMEDYDELCCNGEGGFKARRLEAEAVALKEKEEKDRVCKLRALVRRRTRAHLKPPTIKRKVNVDSTNTPKEDEPRATSAGGHVFSAPRVPSSDSGHLPDAVSTTPISNNNTRLEHPVRGDSYRPNNSYRPSNGRRNFNEKRPYYPFKKTEPARQLEEEAWKRNMGDDFPSVFSRRG